MTNFWKAADNHVKKIKKISPKAWVVNNDEYYRLYYYPDGSVMGYGTSDHELPGPYVIIDKQTFHESRYDLQVVNKKVINPNKIPKQVCKLVPSDKGTETLKDDITVIGKGQHWGLKFYDES
jgi:hypothetical protein